MEQLLTESRFSVVSYALYVGASVIYLGLVTEKMVSKDISVKIVEVHLWQILTLLPLEPEKNLKLGRSILAV